MRIGWDYLSAGEQTYAIAGAVVGLGAYLMLKATFMWVLAALADIASRLFGRRAKRKKAKAKAGRR